MKFLLVILSCLLFAANFFTISALPEPEPVPAADPQHRGGGGRYHGGGGDRYHGGGDRYHGGGDRYHGGGGDRYHGGGGGRYHGRDRY